MFLYSTVQFNSTIQFSSTIWINPTIQSPDHRCRPVRIGLSAQRNRHIPVSGSTWPWSCCPCWCHDTPAKRLLCRRHQVSWRGTQRSRALEASLPPDGRGGWSNDGCYQSLDNSDDNNIVCKCNHLTNFAMLMVSAVYNNHHPTRTVIPHWIMIFRLTCKYVVCRWFLAIFTVFFRQPPECVDLRKCVQ